MMKFFRKYNKQLLAVFMVLLMVVFLGGSALEGMLNPSNNRVVATSKLGDITLQDQLIAQQTTGLLANLGMDWRRPAGMAAEPLQEMHWILLLREARELGLRTDPATVRAWFAPDQLNLLASQLRVRQDRILSAVADLNAVQQAAFSIAGASAPSEADITAAARDALEAVKVHAVVLAAKALADDSYQPDEAAIQAHFEKYRDKPAGGGVNFGYYREPSVQVQYIEIDRNRIAEEMTVPDLARLARDHYDAHRASDPAFRRPPEDMRLPEGFEGPALDPLLTWEEARDIAEMAARRAQAGTVADRLATRLLQYTSEVWFEAERGEDGYKDAPVHVQDAGYYANLITRLSDFPTAMTVGTTEFFTQAAARDVAKLGPSAFRPARGAVERFPALIGRSEGFVPEIPKDQNVGSTDYYAMFQTCPFPVSDAETGNVYVFRAIGARPGRPAESVAEVRDELIEDLRLLRGYEAATARGESLHESMVAGGTSLREAFDADPALMAMADTAEGEVAGYVDPPPFSRVPKFQASQGRPDAGIYIGGLGIVGNDVVDQCFALGDAAVPTSVMPIPNRALVLVVEFVETNPPVRDEFDELREQLGGQLAMVRRFDALSAWLDPERIQARSGFEFATE
jgi:hypothetical protein